VLGAALSSGSGFEAALSLGGYVLSVGLISPRHEAT